MLRTDIILPCKLKRLPSIYKYSTHNIKYTDNDLSDNKTSAPNTLPIINCPYNLILTVTPTLISENTCHGILTAIIDNPTLPFKHALLPRKNVDPCSMNCCHQLSLPSPFQSPRTAKIHIVVHSQISPVRPSVRSKSNETRFTHSEASRGAM